MNRAWRLLGVAGIVSTLVSACSGVPTSSAPQVIGPASGATPAAAEPMATPQAGADARNIVQDFFRANIGEPDDPRGAHLFLTPAEQSKWSDNTVTVLQQPPRAGVIESGPNRTTRVTVTGVQIGRLAADGTYTPELSGSGGGGQPWAYTLRLRRVEGQWRIDDLPDGLVIGADDFANEYRPARLLYFFDLQEQHLVPDLRYSGLTTPQAIASWQLTQLVEGPRSELSAAVRTEVPNQLGASARPSVTVATGPLVTVELPGSSQLDPQTKRRLAAQLMATLGQTEAGTVMTITDGGRPVNIPNIPERFTKADVADATGLFRPREPVVFYIDGGRLVDANGQPVSGPIGVHGQPDLTSVAVASRNSSNYLVAATMGSGTAQTFWMGNLSAGLHKVALAPGELTRPTWAPGLHEAWVARGSVLYRVAEGAPPVPVPTDLAGARIRALRFSADGSRMAMIVVGPNGASQVWVGAVIRVGDTVRLDAAEPITPPDYTFTDVAWNDDTTLYVIGHDPAASPGVYSVQVDGSNLQARPSSGLPAEPDSITAAPGGSLPAWVSAGGAVFEGTSDWEGPNNRTTIGMNPVYLE